MTLSPWASAWRAMAMPIGVVQAVMSHVRGEGCGGKVGFGGLGLVVGTGVIVGGV